MLAVRFVPPAVLHCSCGSTLPRVRLVVFPVADMLLLFFTDPNGTVVLGPPPVASSGSFPAQNAQGQRICRQCGLPGRYKDGKCVEKWGPGPEGPGTVCDR